MIRFLILMVICMQVYTAQYNFNSFESSELALPNVLSIEKPSFSNNVQMDSKESLYSKENGRTCQEITVPMCRNIEYNTTSFPNQFNHETQQEAAAEAHQFWALVEINCAKELKFFLCSMYTPICVPNYPQPIKACKSVCVRARLGCEKYMKKFGFEWPEHMNCDLFPEYGSSKEVCMDPMDAEEQQKRKQLNINHNLNGQKTKLDKSSKTSLKINKKLILSSDYENDIIKSEIANRNREFNKLDKLCVHPFIKLTNSKEFNKISTSGVTNCAQPCQSVYFSHQERQLTYYWLLFWAFLCLLSSFCTTCTYLIDSSRFRYPEKPIIYMSICFLFITIGYMMRFIFGHELACDSNNAIHYSNNLSSLKCTLTFILTYFFGMAGSVWWVIVSLTWFLAAGLKWSTEAISKYGTYFHLIAWLIPFVKTFLVLSMSLVDGDALSGMCYVGNLNNYNLKMFVIYPAVIYLLIGSGFLIAGFISLIRIRNMIKRQNSDLSKAHKLEKLMIRIGIFSILYTVPASCVIACQVYELYYRNEWEKTILCKNLNFKRGLFQQFEENYDFVDELCSSENSEQLPEFSVFLIKYFMGLIIGITSGFWIWTGKSLESWKNFFKRILGYSTNDDCNSEINSDIETSSCFPLFSSSSTKKKICRLQKNSVVYFQANDEDKNQANFYDKEIQNFKFSNPYSNQNQAQIIYQKPESLISLQYTNNPTNTMSTTSSNGFNNSYPFKYNHPNVVQTNSGAFIYDYNSGSTLQFKQLQGTTVNTTTTTNGSSLPSTIVSIVN
ncbi:unnamed protein product [Brachionus calyciflorus]|uniref:Uncharacterized protein n=1 Tax=Brachionus calyciflorus TaxID=104777 RepID=A0A813N859_9BILA|nr:unnamed protein product [Brachionus calyciflorus]